MSRQEMPIFTRTFDFLTWLLPITNNFPRAQRFSATQRLLDAAFDLREHLEEANLRRGTARHSSDDRGIRYARRRCRQWCIERHRQRFASATSIGDSDGRRSRSLQAIFISRLGIESERPRLGRRTGDRAGR